MHVHCARKRSLTSKHARSTLGETPMTSKNATRAEMVGVRLTLEERTALAGLAAKYGETPAGMLRRLMHNALRAQARRVTSEH
jgi:hypothetical protein